MPADPLFWTMAILAVVIVGLSKSGLVAALGMVTVPLLTFVMPPREAAGMMLPILLAIDAIAIWSYRKDIEIGLLKIMLPGAILGIGIGWALSAQISDDWVNFLLGTITLIFVLDYWIPIRKKLQERRGKTPQGDNALLGGFWGSVAGFTSFVSHTGGPPYQIYALPRNKEPRLYAGTSAWFFAIVNTVKLVPYFFLGQINVTSLQLSAILAPVGMISVLVGIALVRKISVVLFYRIAFIGVFLLALKLLWDSSSNLFFG